MKKKRSLVLIFSILLMVVFFSPDYAYGREMDISFLTNEYVTTILLILGFIFIIVELFIPNFGIFGILGLISFILFFIGNINAGYRDFMTVLIFLVGAILLIIELFVPSFGIIGISGITLTVLGIVLSSQDLTTGIYSLLIAVVLALLVSIVLIKFGYRSNIFSRIVLDSGLDKKEGFRSGKDYSYLSGEVGVSITDLRPSGKISVGDVNYDALSMSEYIKAGESVLVDRVEGSKIIVRRKK